MKKIFLMKDYTVKFSDNIEKFYKDIQFILFPCDLELNTYQLLEPNKYMLNMGKAKVVIESVVQRCGYDYKDHYYPIGRIKKEMTSYDELIQYLFSIEKTNYYNKVMNMTESRDVPPYMTIKYCFFSIRLYDKNGKVIFKKKINLSEEVSLSEIYISEFFSGGTILNIVSDIYFSELSLFKECISIDPIHNKWDLNHNTYKYNLCALWLEETNTISFFYKDDMKKFKYVNNIFVSVDTFAKSIEDGETDTEVYCCNSPEYDLAYFDYQLIIEWIIYLPYINMVLRMCALVSNKECNMDESRIHREITEDDFYIRTYVEIDVHNKTHAFAFRDSNPFNMEKLMELLNEGK